MMHFRSCFYCSRPKIDPYDHHISFIKIWNKDYKTFFMLKSAETKIYPAHKCLNANGILTFICKISYRLCQSKPKFSTSFEYFCNHEQFKFHAQLR